MPGCGLEVPWWSLVLEAYCSLLMAGDIACLKKCVNYFIIFSFFAFFSKFKTRFPAFVVSLYWKWLILVRMGLLIYLRWCFWKEWERFYWSTIKCVSFPIPGETRHIFFGLVIYVQNNQKQTGGGRGNQLFQPSTCPPYREGLWGGLCSTLPVGSQTFWVTFSHVVTLKGLQFSYTLYSMLDCLMGSGTRDLW